MVPCGDVRTGVKGNYRLASDLELAPIARRMVDMAVAGQSNGRIANWLNAESELGLARDSSQERIMVCTVLDLADGSVFAEFRYGALTRATAEARDGTGPWAAPATTSPGH